MKRKILKILIDIIIAIIGIILSNIIAKLCIILMEKSLILENLFTDNTRLLPMCIPLLFYFGNLFILVPYVIYKVNEKIENKRYFKEMDKE